MFINGESDKTGGVGIILNKNSTLAWKQAGSKPPIAIKGQIMGLHLEFGNKKNLSKSLQYLYIYHALDPKIIKKEK